MSLLCGTYAGGAKRTTVIAMPGWQTGGANVNSPWVRGIMDALLADVRRRQALDPPQALPGKTFVASSKGIGAPDDEDGLADIVEGFEELFDIGVGLVQAAGYTTRDHGFPVAQADSSQFPMVRVSSADFPGTLRSSTNQAGIAGPGVVMCATPHGGFQRQSGNSACKYSMLRYADWRLTRSQHHHWLRRRSPP